MAKREVLTPEFYECLEELESETGNLSQYDIKDKELETLRKKANIRVKYSKLLGAKYQTAEKKTPKVPKHSIDYRKLKQMKEDRDLLYKDLAQACGIKTKSIRDKFWGKTYLMEHELKRVAEVFEVSVEELKR